MPVQPHAFTDCLSNEETSPNLTNPNVTWFALTKDTASNYTYFGRYPAHSLLERAVADRTYVAGERSTRTLDEASGGSPLAAQLT